MDTRSLIALIDDMYPSATNDTVKLKYLNMAQDNLSDQFGLVVTDSTLLTILNTDEYALPAGIEDISQIETFDISTQVPVLGQPVDRYATSRYGIGYKDDKPMSGACIYQNYSSTGVKSLIVYPPPTVSGLTITIRYHAKLTALSLSDLSKVPEFDSRYHHLLAVFACYQICANGSSPDSIQANRFSDAWEQGLQQLWKHTYQQNIIAPRKRRDNKQWHSNR